MCKGFEQSWSVKEAGGTLQCPRRTHCEQHRFGWCVYKEVSLHEAAQAVNLREALATCKTVIPARFFRNVFSDFPCHPTCTPTSAQLYFQLFPGARDHLAAWHGLLLILCNLELGIHISIPPRKNVKSLWSGIISYLFSSPHHWQVALIVAPGTSSKFQYLLMNY